MRFSNGEGDDDAIADFQFFDFFTDFNNFTHTLMAKDVAFFHFWNEPTHQMQVGAANGAGCHRPSFDLVEQFGHRTGSRPIMT